MSKEIILKFDEEHFSALLRMATMLLDRELLDMLWTSYARNGRGALFVEDKDVLPYRKLQHLILLQLHHGNKDELIEIRNYFNSMIEELGGETK